ncbi:hypothetical protein [Treponema sp.]|uniref:hypothetical protein n=1 Tax=Treponema sp. TaxID=166 RepID=UPI003F037BC1
MAISDELRKEFNERVRPIKDRINDCLKEEKDGAFSLRSLKEGIEEKKISLCEKMIYTATLQMSINSISLEMLETKNNDTLNDARKSIYKAIIYLEEIVTNTVDCPFSDLEQRQALVAFLPIEKKLDIVKKIGLAIDLLVSAFGENSKWKESFVEMRARHVVVAKNFIDMKQACKDYFDHESPVYETTAVYIRLLRGLLDKCAMDYRDRYELASRRLDDMRMAINLLIANRRIAIALGDNTESENIRKKALVWKTKMEADVKSGSSK